MKQLPEELWLTVMECLIGNPNAVALPPHSEATKAFLALSIFSATSEIALRLLYTRCVYIDSAWRLKRFLRTLDYYGSSSYGPANYVTQMFLCPSVHYDMPGQLPVSDLMQGFCEQFEGDIINDSVTVKRIHKLMTYLAPSLRSLVVYLPKTSHYGDEDVPEENYKILRDAFEQLTELREMVNFGDDLAMDCPPVYKYVSMSGAIYGGHPPPPDYQFGNYVWAKCPHLERLALGCVYSMGSQILKAMNRAPMLNQMVVLQADPSVRDMHRMLETIRKPLRLAFMHENDKIDPHTYMDREGNNVDTNEVKVLLETAHSTSLLKIHSIFVNNLESEFMRRALDRSIWTTGWNAHYD